MEKHNKKKITGKRIKKLILIAVVLAFAFLYAHVEKKTYFYDKAIETNDYVSTGILVEQKITQTFVSKEDCLDGIEAKCTITGAVENVTIHYALTDLETNQVVAEGSVAGSDVKNSKFTKFEFPKLTGCKDKEYSVSFWETGADEGNGITFCLIPEAQTDMELSVKGNETQGVLVARTLTNRFDIETFVVVLIFVAYITLFMKLLYKLFK